MKNKPHFIASIFGASAVLLGAFGAHYLKTIFIPEMLSSFETGIKYQFYHSIVLLFISIAPFENNQKSVLQKLFSIGILLFSGSIYLLCLLKTYQIENIKAIGILTPIGGLFLIFAWSTMAFFTFKKN